MVVWGDPSGTQGDPSGTRHIQSDPSDTQSDPSDTQGDPSVTQHTQTQSTGCATSQVTDFPVPFQFPSRLVGNVVRGIPKSRQNLLPAALPPWWLLHLSGVGKPFPCSCGSGQGWCHSCDTAVPVLSQSHPSAPHHPNLLSLFYTTKKTPMGSEIILSLPSVPSLSPRPPRRAGMPAAEAAELER